MSDEAVLGFGARFALYDGSTLVEFDGVVSVNRPNLTIETVDTTHHGSAGGIRTKMPGLGDPGDLKVRIFYSPDSATDLLILAQLAAMASKSATSRTFKVWVKEADGTYQGVTGVCIPTGYEVDDVVIDDKMTAMFSAAVSGGTTQAAT